MGACGGKPRDVVEDVRLEQHPAGAPAPAGADTDAARPSLDRVLQQQRLFIRETTQRIERTLDPGLAEREAAKQASLPIWAR